MAAAKKKAPAKKQKVAATKKVPQKATAKTKKIKVVIKAKAKAKAVKAPASKKPKVVVKAMAKAKAVKAPASKKPKVVVKAMAKAKAVKAPASKKPKIVVKAKAKKVVAAKKSVAPKKGTVAVAPVADRFRGLKSMLIAKRDALLNEAKQEIQKYVSGENRQLVDTAIDEADWAAVEISEDINLKRLGAQRQLLKDVEECLRKVNEGTYGICEDCGEEISEKRLRVIPTASLCIDCKEQREKMAILEQDTEI